MDAMRGIKHRGVAPLLSVKMEGNMRVVSRSRERRPTKAGKETQPPPGLQSQEVNSATPMCPWKRNTSSCRELFQPSVRPLSRQPHRPCPDLDQPTETAASGCCAKLLRLRCLLCSKRTNVSTNQAKSYSWT